MNPGKGVESNLVALKRKEGKVKNPGKGVERLAEIETWPLTESLWIPERELKASQPPAASFFIRFMNPGKGVERSSMYGVIPNSSRKNPGKGVERAKCGIAFLYGSEWESRKGSWKYASPP